MKPEDSPKQSNLASREGFKVLGSSFRDPSGFVFKNRDGVILRQINQVYEKDFLQFKQSGLLDSLIKRKWLIPHEELSLEYRLTDDAIAVLAPESIPLISTPSEWCFSQLKDAALLTLEIALLSLEHGMILKDASAFNVQFIGSRPIFIDTLSFTNYQEGEAWVAYRQFCRHFLAPLALMAKTDIRLAKLIGNEVDGIDLDLASKLLPSRTRFSLGLLMHLHLNSKFQTSFSKTGKEQARVQAVKSRKITKAGLFEIIRSLKKTIFTLKWDPVGTQWADYYKDNSYTGQTFENKQEIVRKLLGRLQPNTVWDLGANTGVFSKIACESGAYTCSMDMDPACVERNYLELRGGTSERILPFVVNLASPTPAIGWNLSERESILARGPCHTALALALIHHLAIGNNLPFDRIARCFASTCQHLIMEFVPKSDVQVQRLLNSREDVFHGYHLDGFLQAFRGFFEITASEPVEENGRIIFEMKSRLQVLSQTGKVTVGQGLIRGAQSCS